jgi:hypothetical protein
VDFFAYPVFIPDFWLPECLLFVNFNLFCFRNSMKISYQETYGKGSRDWAGSRAKKEVAGVGSENEKGRPHGMGPAPA